MQTKNYNYLSKDVRGIRQKVFMDEQGFQNEFDDIDSIATHIVMYNESNEPIATCRIFEGEEPGAYLLDRKSVV